MWPDDDDEDEFDELLDEDDDDEEMVARVDAAFKEERARIRAATEPGALNELRETYEEQVADEVLVGVAALRAGDLVELIDDRLAELEARLRRQRGSAEEREVARDRADQVARERRDREAAVQRQVAERARREREEGVRVRQERAAVERKALERAGRAEAEQRAAATRLANAKAAETEARVALMQAQAARAARTPARENVAPPCQSRPSPLERAVTEPVSEAEGPMPASPIEVADREALMAEGRWPLVVPPRESLFWSPDAGWPKDWTLTGFDLASFRARVGVTQAVMAGQFGVETIEVSRAEAKAREKVRPALQIQLARAIDAFRAAIPFRTEATTARASTLAPSVGAPPLTGADLAKYRETNGFSQREAAERLSVAHGTVAKAELQPAQPLGERLQHALGAALRP